MVPQNVARNASRETFFWRISKGPVGGEIFVEGSSLLGQTSLEIQLIKSSGTPKSSILIGFSIINHPIWGTPIFGNTHVHTLPETN